MRMMLKSKIHRAVITDVNLEYDGSITLDPDLMLAADILPNELVHVLNLNNGARIETYAIAGNRGSGEVCINGAAARLAQKGDIVIILAYCVVTDEETQDFQPKLVHVDADNKILSTPKS